MSKTFIEKVSDIQTELKAPKNQRNNFGNYNFRNKEDILEALKPLLKGTGLVVTINDKIINIGKYNYVESTVTITDGEKSLSATSSAREADEQKGMAPAQITGASNSYAGKYALGDLFLLDDTKDADATNTHGKDASAVKAQPGAPQKQAQDNLSTLSAAAKSLGLDSSSGQDGVQSPADTAAPVKKGFGSRFGNKTETKKEIY